MSSASGSRPARDSSSVSGSRPESAFLYAAALTLVLTAAVALPVATAIAGREGTLGAAAALAFLVVLFGFSALLHVIAAPFGRVAWLVLTLGGLALRVSLYIALILTLRDVGGLHPTALGLTAALGIVVGQALEMRALVRTRSDQIVAAEPGTATRKELEGVDR